MSNKIDNLKSVLDGLDDISEDIDKLLEEV